MQPNLKNKIDAGVHTVKVSLTNAEIKALRASPKTLVPAPREGRLQLVAGTARLIYGGTNVFTETADNLAVKYTDGSGVAVSNTIECTGFIDQSATTETSITPKTDAIVASSGAVGKPLVLHNTGDGEFGGNAGADNLMEVWISYRVLR